MSNDRASIAEAARQGVRWTAIGTVGVLLLQLVQVAILARFLLPSDFGAMAMVLVVVTVASTFSELGLSSAIIQRIDPQRHELATLYSVNIAAGALLYLIIWLVAPSLQSLFQIEQLESLIRGSGVVFVIAPWSVQVRALLQKALRFRALTVASLAAASVGTVAGALVAIAGAGIWALVATFLVTEFVRTVGLLVVGLRENLLSGFGWRLSSVRSYMAFGGYRTAAMTANSINSRIDQLIVGTMLGSTLLGYYSVAHRLVSEPVQRINGVVTRVAFPIFSLVQEDTSTLQRGYLRAVSMLLALTAPVLLGFAAVADTAIPLFLGSGWTDAVLPAQLLAGYALLRSIANAGGSIIFAKGRADWSLYWNLGLLLIIPLTVWIAAHAGTIVAIAGTLLLLQGLLLVIHYALFLRRLIGACGSKYLTAVARPISIAALMALLVASLDYALPALPTALELATQVAAGGLIYLGASMQFQRGQVREVLNVLRPKRDWASSFDRSRDDGPTCKLPN